MTSTADAHRPFMQTGASVLFKPNFAKADRHVLRFFGYFKESVPESNLETERVRRLICHLYLVDNTVSINEEKMLNSGIPQGSFLKRQNVPHHVETNRFVNAWDFKIGEYTEIFGKRIYIYEADDYTRSFYQQSGKPQPNPSTCEQDAFSTNVLPRFANKAWNGLNSSVMNGRVPSQKQFLANDRKVLRFYAFSEYPYVINYYLADDTMEIREVKYPNR